MRKKLLRLTMAVAIGCSAVLPSLTSVKAKEAATYEIYPTPHSVEYKDDSFVIRKEVNVVWEENIDKYTKDKLETVLENKGITMNDELGEIQDGATNILVGIKDSNGVADTYMDKNVNYKEETFNHIDPYVLDVNDGVITIVGEDTNGAYYGVVSLMHILNQMEGRTIRNLTIEDYSDTQTRGFIEGYYGIPWSNADRISLMRFGGDFKMTSYVFAPKDDPYHKEKWRDPYPADEFEEVKKMVQAGLESKCRFVWTAHPFMGGFNANDVDGEIEALLGKFEQLYGAGVRQFGVLGDDVGNLNKDIVIRIMKAVSDWGKQKGDVFDPVFCPAGYNDSWQGDYSELNTYDAGFPENVQIFWTGQAVCKPVEQATLNNFRRKNLPSGKEARRAPLFWLNWPVNDINMSRLMMGKGSLLHTDIVLDDIKGVVTNPMQDAQASKVAIFAVADYAWNVKKFNADKSWADSFKYIDEDAADALYTLAKHMSDPNPNGHGLVLDESEALRPLLEEFQSAYQSGNLDKDKAAKLISEFEIIKQACVDFHALSKNEVLKAELLPFTNSLKDLMDANILFVETALALEEGRTNDVWAAYSNATAKLKDSEHHARKTLSGTQAALPGSKRLRPFANKMNELLVGPVNAIIDDSKVITSLITSRTDTPNGALDKLIDNDESTQVIWKNPSSTTAGTYIGLSYSKEITLKDVTFKMGQSENPRDTFDSAKIQYTVDGTNWVDLEGSAYTDTRSVVSVGNLDLKIRGIRLISTADKGNMWLGCKDIVVNSGVVSGTGFYNTKNMEIRSGSIADMTDGKPSTVIAFSEYPHKGDPDKQDGTFEGAYVGIQFDGVHKINQFTLIQDADDHILKGKLEYQNADNEWVAIDSYDIAADFRVSFSAVEAKAIRLVNSEWVKKWWQVKEVSAAYGDVSSIKKTLTSNMKPYSGNSLDRLLDGNESTYFWSNSNITSGQYIQMDLGRIIDVGEVYFIVGSNDAGEDKWVKYDLKYSTDGTNWTTFKSYTGANSGKDVHKEKLGKKARYVRIESTANKGNWAKFAEFNVSEDTTLPTSEYTYTNVNAYKNLKTVHTASKTAFVEAKGITLKPNDYLGIKLERIKDITNITVNATSDALTLQTSKNGVVWSDVQTKTYEDARYIRLINKTNENITFDLNEFVVESYEVEPVSVLETNFASANTHLKAFDDDRTTEAVLQASQHAGKYIVYDLGQVIDLESLKLVLHDGTTDFPRHAKVSVSNDANTWKEVMLIGKQNENNPGEAEGTDNIADLFTVHETSYYTKEVKGLNTQARYIKFEITRNKAGADKWVRIREIELNGGNMYLPTQNNPTVTTTGGEAKGNEALNIIDKDVSTTYKPTSKEAGVLTYYLSDNTDINKITILQNPSLLSYAKVKVDAIKDGEVVNGAVIGELSASLNEFNVSDFEHVLSISIEWEAGKALEIYEVITSSVNVEAADTTKLEAYYNAHKDEDTNTWTPASVEAWERALRDAETLLNNPEYKKHATSMSVNTLLTNLKNAYENKVLKPDMNAYQNALNELTKDVLTQENYLVSTWKVYEERLANANAALENENVSQEELDVLLEKLSEAKDGLIYEVTSIEDLNVLYNDLNGKYKAEDYTKTSYDAFLAVLEETKALLASDKENRVLPATVKAASDKLNKANEDLVSLVELKAVIKKAKDTSTDGYVEISVERLKAKIVEAETLLNKADASKMEVSNMVAALQEAINGLAPKEDLEGVKAEIDRLKGLSKDKYTKVSYTALMNTIEEVEALLKTDTDYATYLEMLKAKEDALVSVSHLNEALDKVNAVNKDIYKKEGVAALEKVVNEAKKLLEDGSVEAIEKACSDIEKAIDALRLNDAYVEKALSTYTDALSGSYTTASKKALEDKLNEVKGSELTLVTLEKACEELDVLKDCLVDTSALLKAIEEAEKVDANKYTSASYQAYKDLIAEAKGLLENGKVTEIADMVESLNDKESILKEKASDFSELEALVKEYSSKDLTGFTEESKNAFLDALNIAKFMLETKDFTAAEVNAQIQAMKDAYAALEKEPTSQEGGTNTGDATNTAGWMFMMMLSLGAVALSKNKNQM